MTIEPADTDVTETIADFWVDLAAEQQQYGSHLEASANRAAIQETIVQAIVTDGLYVARADGDDELDAASGTILGFVMFSFDSGMLATTVERGTIENLYVRPPYRDQGLGSALLETAVEKLEERGAAVVKLDVMAPNEDAQRFYERHGFEPHRVQLTKSVESDNHSKDGG